MRVRAKQGGYETAGAIVGTKEGYFLIEPDEKPRMLDFLRRVVGKENLPGDYVEASRRVLRRMRCLEPDEVMLRCVPIGWEGLAILEPAPGMDAVLIEAGPKHMGSWSGRIVSVEGEIVRIRLDLPVEAIEGLDLPDSLVVSAVLPEDVRDSVTEISRAMHIYWTRSGVPIPPGRWRRGRTTFKMRTSRNDYVPFETKAWILDKPIPLAALLDVCASQGIQPQECILHGGILVSMPVDMGPTEGLSKTLRPAIPDE
jgi:hypothetical protein